MIKIKAALRIYAYLGFPFYFFLFQKMSVNAILLHSIAFLKRMFMWSGRPVSFTITSITVDPLNSIVPASVATWDI